MAKPRPMTLSCPARGASHEADDPSPYGLVLVSEELAVGRMRDVELALEDE